MTATRPISVYECDLCGARALTDGRCEGCGTSMHRLGLGGCCPICDQPIAVDELLNPAPSENGQEPQPLHPSEPDS